MIVIETITPSYSNRANVADDDINATPKMPQSGQNQEVNRFQVPTGNH